MASEQLSRRENKTTEKEVHVEKNRVPKMTTHFEHLAEHVKESDVAGAKDTPQHGGTHFESLSDQVHKGTGHSYADKARSTNPAHTTTNVPHQHANMGKFEVRAQAVRDDARHHDASHLQSRTREVSDRERRENRGKVEAEKAAPTTTLQQENRAGGEVKGRVGVATEGPTAVITCKFEGVENRDHNNRELEAERERVKIQEQRRNQQQQSQSTMEDISKYRGQVQENTMQALRGAQDRYERAKQSAAETIGSTTQTAQQKAAQAKDVTIETASRAKDTAMEKAAQAKDVALDKTQQGYVAAKDNLSSATKTAVDYTVPVAEKAKDYTLQAAEMAKSAGGTTASYVGEKAVQAKDVTVEYAGKVAGDLKDKAVVAGWTAADYTTKATVEGTKAVANVVQGTAGYAANKATEIAAKSLGAVKGLAAAAGDTAEEYTARKKEEAKRASSQPQQHQQETPLTEGRKGEFQAKQEGCGIGETIGTYGQHLKPSEETMEKVSGIGETIGTYPQNMKPSRETLEKMKKPLDAATQGGSEVLGAVGETVGEIGETMFKPGERVVTTQNYGTQKQQEGGVLDAIGETISEIAHTTKAIVVGENDDDLETVSKQSVSGGIKRQEEFKIRQTTRKS